MLVSAQKGMVSGQDRAGSAGKDHSFQWKCHKAFRELEHLSRSIQIRKDMSKGQKIKISFSVPTIRIALNWIQFLASENYRALTSELKILIRTCTAILPPSTQNLLFS